MNGRGLVVCDLFGVVFSKGLASSIDRLVAILDRPEEVIARAYGRHERDFDLGVIDETQFWARINADLGTHVRPEVLSTVVLTGYQIDRVVLELVERIRSSSAVVLYTNYRQEWYSVLNSLYGFGACFEKVYVSSETKLLKPDPAVFAMLSKAHNVAAEQMVLVDDEPENVLSMTRWGGQGILFRNVFEAFVDLRKVLGSAVLPYDGHYSGVLLRTANGALVLQRRDRAVGVENAGRLSVFGGRARKGESALDCARRELEEETGLVVRADDCAFMQEFGFPEDRRWVRASYFLVDQIDPSEIKVKEGQGLEVWFPTKATRQEDLTTLPRILIQNLVERRVL